MILKELDPFVATDKFGAAGRRAEEKIAFYLRRGFDLDRDIHVLNGIRLERPGDAAQIDHLIMHAQGFIIIESKSVSDSVEIDANGHWSRWYDRRPEGMNSPLIQARLQADFLHRELTEHLQASGWRGVLSGGFDALTFDTLVAISEKGRIRCAGKLDPAIIKADEVIDRVKALVSQRRPSSLLRRAVSGLGMQDMDRIAEFLMTSHRPAPSAAREPAAAPPPAPGLREPAAAPYVPPARPTPVPPSKAKTSQACSKCSSPNVEIRYGKFGYYFKCHACGGNTAIKAVCPSCGGAAKLRKQAQEFFTDCKEGCGSSALFFTNPS